MEPINKTLNERLVKARAAKRATTGTGQSVEHVIRTRAGHTKKLRYGRKMAVSLMCTECMGWENNPQDCTSPLCPLYPFRNYTMASQK